MTSRLPTSNYRRVAGPRARSHRGALTPLSHNNVRPQSLLDVDAAASAKTEEKMRSNGRSSSSPPLVDESQHHRPSSHHASLRKPSKDPAEVLEKTGWSSSPSQFNKESRDGGASVVGSGSPSSLVIANGEGRRGKKRVSKFKIPAVRENVERPLSFASSSSFSGAEEGATKSTRKRRVRSDHGDRTVPCDPEGGNDNNDRTTEEVVLPRQPCHTSAEALAMLASTLFQDEERQPWEYDVGKNSHPKSYGLSTCSESDEVAMQGLLWSNSDFQILHMLGKGKFGMVYDAQERGTDLDVALKVMNKGKLCSNGTDLNMLRREVEIQSRLKHGNILRFNGYFHDHNSVCLVLEPSPHGDLYKNTSSLKSPEESLGGIPLRIAASYTRQLASALAYLQRQHVAHRDIKPENLLLFGSDMERVKLCDFGWAVHAPPPKHNMRLTLCGTPEYVPPEMLEIDAVGDESEKEKTTPLCSNLGGGNVGTSHKKKKKKKRKINASSSALAASSGSGTSPGRLRHRTPYDARFVDAWALGVLAYEMVTGRTPFYVPADEDDAEERIFGAITNYRVLECSSAGRGEYESFFDFVRGLMRRDPVERMMMADVMDHPWVQTLVHDQSV